VTAQRWLEDKYLEIDNHTAEIWLKQDMMKSVKSVIRLCPNVSKVTQLAALADFTVNCGSGNLEISALRRRVNRGDYDGAAEEFMRWVYARGVKLPGLVKRRSAERSLFMS
jgi:lysozyme